MGQDASISIDGIQAGGTGGTIPTITCSLDSECTPQGLWCEPSKNLCVQCLKTSDCPNGGHCRNNACVAVTGSCLSSPECGIGKICDTSRGLCVQCMKDTDCTTSGQSCVANQCVTIATCQDSRDCDATKVCNPTTKRCVDCVGDNDCTPLTQKCYQNACLPLCETDKTCKPDNMLCDLTNKVCVQCRTHSECSASSYCEGGVCKPDICDSTQAQCAGNGVAACNQVGNGYGQVQSCSSDKPCKAYGGAAACGGPPLPIDGGVTPPIDGGGIAIDGPVCTAATGNPCNSIPKLTGTQTLDGRIDDLCDVPSFVLSAATAAKVNAYNIAPVEEATIRVAWSSAGFHVFINVKDPSVQTVNMVDSSQAYNKSYQGDSIELFVSSSNNVNGLTGNDNNTLHVIVPAEGPAVSVKTKNEGGTSSGTPKELNAAQYKQEITSTGYIVELQLPWPGSGSLNSGSQIRFDIALNGADANFGGVDDMRDGQLVYYVGNVGGSTTCQGNSDGPVPYCDSRTWCTTTLQ